LLKLLKYVQILFNRRRFTQEPFKPNFTSVVRDYSQGCLLLEGPCQQATDHFSI